MKHYKGIDVSKYQGVIDWDKVKADGVEFAIIRAGYGYRTIDEYFKRNMEECARVGIPVGVYWFSYAITEADAIIEAKSCLDAIKPYKLEYPVAFDYEYDSVRYAKDNGVIVDKALASKICDAFCKTIENAGYYVLNYSNPDYLNRYFNAEIANKYDIWLAQWNNKVDLENPPKCNLWQYTSKGKVNGINGNVDMNAAYIDYAGIIRAAGLNNLSKKEEAPAKEWYADAQAWAVANGITDGTRPDEAATRAEVWAMLHRMSKL